jgi:Ca-activated chloride channel family protein
VLQAIDHLDVGQLDDGTAIGDAIGTAVNRLRDAPGPSRVLILMTDGQSNRGLIDPLTAARAALTYHVKIYTIGVGTRGMAPFPSGVGPDGTVHFTMQKVAVDDTLLQHVAAMTGGQYFRATDAATLHAIYQQINQLEKTTIHTTTPVQYAELFRWSLGSAVFLFLLELSIAAVRAPLP